MAFAQYQFEATTQIVLVANNQTRLAGDGWWFQLLWYHERRVRLLVARGRAHAAQKHWYSWRGRESAIIGRWVLHFASLVMKNWLRLVGNGLWLPFAKGFVLQSEAQRWWREFCYYCTALLPVADGSRKYHGGMRRSWCRDLLAGAAAGD